MHIFLLGFMGSGKSTLGKKLARKLGRKFIDLDQYIEKKENLSIAGIFKEKGENTFRSLENYYLQHISEHEEDAVIALGGGTPCFFNNMQIINDSGISIYLELSAEALSARLMQDNEPRPLIQNKTAQELGSFIKEKLEAREKFYKKANISLNATNLTPEKLFQEIYPLLQEKDDKQNKS